MAFPLFSHDLTISVASITIAVFQERSILILRI